MATRKKTINNITKKEGGFDSLGATSRERSITKGSSRTRKKTPGRPRPQRKKPSTTQ
jgi:hypothetical protein